MRRDSGERDIGWHCGNRVTPPLQGRGRGWGVSAWCKFRAPTPTPPLEGRGLRAESPNAQMGPASLPTPLAPVAFTGVSPRGAIARRSRRHPVPSGGEFGAGHHSHRPAGSVVGIPVGALRFIWPQPGRNRAASIHAEPELPAADDAPAAALSPATRQSGDRRDYACFQAARFSPPHRGLPTFALPSGFDTFRSPSGLPASMDECCLSRASRSSFARVTYPLSPDLVVDKCGQHRRPIFRAPNPSGPAAAGGGH